MSTREEILSRENILRKRWDTERNEKDFNIDLVRGKNKHWWICELKHYWYATGQRITETNGCPYCANKYIWKGFNDVASTHPHLMEQWDFEKNTYNPTEIFAGTRKDIFWKCKSCTGKWTATLYSRAQGNGCPYCANKKVLEGFNDLQTKYPEIAKEWNYELNDLGPNEYLYGSHSKVYWLCSEKHTWPTAIKHRVNGTGCPDCARIQKTSKEENELYDAVVSLISKLHEKGLLERNVKVVQSDRKVLKGWELDIFIPDLNIGIEFNGIYWHSDEFLKKKMGISAEEYHQGKVDRAKEASVDLVFVWQDDWRENRKVVLEDLEKFLVFGKKSNNLKRFQ